MKKIVTIIISFTAVLLCKAQMPGSPDGYEETAQPANAETLEVMKKDATKEGREAAINWITTVKRERAAGRNPNCHNLEAFHHHLNATYLMSWGESGDPVTGRILVATAWNAYLETLIADRQFMKWYNSQPNHEPIEIE
jgi:hypothetical protein